MIKEPEPIDESNNGLAIRSVDRIELEETIDPAKIEIGCFLCDENFNSRSTLDEHLLVKHQMDREKHVAYLKWQPNEVSKTKGKN